MTKDELSGFTIVIGVALGVMVCTLFNPFS